MPYTVAVSFEQFRSDTVDLAASDVLTARRSRDYLQDQIKAIASKDDYFPRLYGAFEHFGSFARKTKIQPLDDIDLMVLLSGKNTRVDYLTSYTYGLKVMDSTSVLWRYTNGDGYVSSIKVLNKFKGSLSSVSNYRKAEIKRNGVAVVLSLGSYEWVFDIVPAFPVTSSQGGTDCFLIPNGSGQWMKTDPRHDQTALTDANVYHNSNLIPLLRLMKYWNVRHYNTSRLRSYHFETLVLNGMRYQACITSMRHSLPTAFTQLAAQVLSSCPDPKGLGPNLDEGMSWETRSKVNKAAITMAQYAQWALEEEQKGNHKEAIKWWGYIFHDFPTYGS